MVMSTVLKAKPRKCRQRAVFVWRGLEAKVEEQAT